MYKSSIFNSRFINNFFIFLIFLQFLIQIVKQNNQAIRAKEENKIVLYVTETQRISTIYAQFVKIILLNMHHDSSILTSARSYCILSLSNTSIFHLRSHRESLIDIQDEKRAKEIVVANNRAVHSHRHKRRGDDCARMEGISSRARRTIYIGSAPNIEKPHDAAAQKNCSAR